MYLGILKLEENNIWTSVLKMSKREIGGEACSVSSKISEKRLRCLVDREVDVGDEGT